MNIETIKTRLAGGEQDARAVVETALAAAEDLNETLGAFLQIDRAGALARVGELDARRDESLNG
ncbi:MAG TPA: hypothetical protein VF634_12115, partial [Pyrinomonadaceae bacterium]